jgi:hypothetical protein
LIDGQYDYRKQDLVNVSALHYMSLQQPPAQALQSNALREMLIRTENTKGIVDAISLALADNEANHNHAVVQHRYGFLWKQKKHR